MFREKKKTKWTLRDINFAEKFIVKFIFLTVNRIIALGETCWC